jgi:hypothetical protein
MRWTPPSPVTSHQPLWPDSKEGDRRVAIRRFTEALAHVGFAERDAVSPQA